MGPRVYRLILSAAAVLGVVHPLFGQGYDDPPRTLEEAQSRFRRAEFFLNEMDTNHNGVLEADEVSGRRQYYADRMLRRAGIEPSYPMAIERAREGLNRYYMSSIQGAVPGQMMPGQPMPGYPAPPATGGLPGSTAPSAGASVVPAVPGFGVVAGTAVPPVPGFGPVVPPPPTSLMPAGASPSASTGSSSSPSSPSSSFASSHSSHPPSSSHSSGDEERRYRDYAKGLLGQYDKNRNAVLDAEEWGAMSNNPKAADRNGDNKVTYEELVAWLMEMAKKGPHGSSGGSNRSGGKKVPYRIPSAIERLPPGLPDWFLSKDTNRDGQISMAEFAQDWSDSKIADFGRYDLNFDGMVTPTECLRAEKALKDAKPSGSRDPRDSRDNHDRGRFERR